MGTCEMCGKEATVVSAKVASSTMQLCSQCRKHGVEINEKPSHSKVFHKRKKSETQEVIVDDYGSRISKALHKKGLNSHQLARAINLKESSLHKFLCGKIQPEIDIAKKIEKFLEISLVQEKEIQSAPQDYLIDDDEESSGTSLGDILKEQLKNKK